MSRKDSCRGCGSYDLAEVLDMGLMPLAGDFRAQGERNELYPLAIDLCNACGLLQVREIVPLDILFNDHYAYASSSVPGLVRHFEHYANEVARPVGSKTARLLEIGCNDGVFLEPLQKRGYKVVGIDASQNVAHMARDKGLDVHVGLFERSQANDLLNQYGKFDVITCSNVFAHNPGVNEFISGVDLLLEPRHGEFWVEVHSAHSLHEGLQWDCFYHEHCFYWTIHALKEVMGRHGYCLKRYKFTDMHGGAIRAVFSKSEPRVQVFEPTLGPSEWEVFRSRCLRSREVLHDSLKVLPVRYAYGAAGRAVTLINWANLAGGLEYVVDGSSLRYGKTIPNTNIPIISEESFFASGDIGDWCFVSAHNYIGGIQAKIEHRVPDRSIRFITPLPYVTIR